MVGSGGVRLTLSRFLHDCPAYAQPSEKGAWTNTKRPPKTAEQSCLTLDRIYTLRSGVHGYSITSRQSSERCPFQIFTPRTPFPDESSSFYATSSQIDGCELS